MQNTDEQNNYTTKKNTDSLWSGFLQARMYTAISIKILQYTVIYQ